MNKWRLWLGAGVGEVVSQELTAAMAGLHGPEKRRARRLVRRGQAAEDVVVARYAVAYARERQRRFTRSRRSARFEFAVGLAVGLAGAAATVYFFSRAEHAHAAAAAVFAAVISVLWARSRHDASRREYQYLRDLD